MLLFIVPTSLKLPPSLTPTAAMEALGGRQTECKLFDDIIIILEKWQGFKCNIYDCKVKCESERNY